MFTVIGLMLAKKPMHSCPCQTCANASNHGGVDAAYRCLL